MFYKLLIINFLIARYVFKTSRIAKFGIQTQDREEEREERPHYKETLFQLNAFK